MENRLKIAMVGIGNAGCQAAEVAQKNHHRVFCINSSERDLDDQILSKEIPSFLIGNKRGAGKNRQSAKDFMKVELNRLFNETPAFTDIVEDADVIVVVASTAGGTGSGAGPLMVNRLMTIYPNKVIIFFGIMPKHSESAQAQFNTVECLNEVTNPRMHMTYALSDLHTYEDLPNEEAFKKTAEYIADCMNVIRGDYLKQTPYGMIDETDMLTILSSEGYLMINHRENITKNDLEGKTSQSIMIDMIKSTPAVPQQNGKILRNVGIIINTSDSEEDPSKAGNFSELEGFIGKPLATFVNYSVEMKPRSDFSVIMSGMNKPIDRISECTEIAKECEVLFNSVDSGSVESELKDLDAIRGARSGSNKNRILGVSNVRKSDVDLNDIPDIF